jgi:hypothetical protein
MYLKVGLVEILILIVKSAWGHIFRSPWDPESATGAKMTVTALVGGFD